MHTYQKKMIAALMAAVMMLPTAANLSEPLCASAGEVLGESTFDYKIVPWHTVSQSPAKQNFSIDEGALHVQIICPTGSDRERWDLQVCYDNLNFKEGHRYKVSFKVKARRNGMELNSAIYDTNTEEPEIFVLDGATGDMHMGPYMGGSWFMAPVLMTTEYQTFEGIFTPTRDVNGARWGFEYARGTQYSGNAEEGDELWFDDMSIECLDCDECNADPNASYGVVDRSRSGFANNYISVNQLGYIPGLAKTAVLSDNQGDFYYGAENITLTGSYTYEIVDAASKTVVYTGKTGKIQSDRDSGDQICKIDFTEFDEPGEYYLRIKGKKWRSAVFTISRGIYSQEGHSLLTDVLNYFYQNRAGADIEAGYITSGDRTALSHTDSADEAVGLVQKKWEPESKTLNIAETNLSSKINTSGGWYTGADYDKNMTEGGMALWTLQNMYERSLLTEGEDSRFAVGTDTVSIPESGNNYPDILDECRCELDYMAKMKVQPDEKTWGEYAGLYYHSLQGIGFSAKQPDYEHEYHAAYAVQPPTFAATLNYAACAAQGARLWADYDSEYAAGLLQSAKDAYQAYRTFWYDADVTETIHPFGYRCTKEELNEKSQYAPVGQGVMCITDGDTDVLDDAYWAACELYITAKELDDADADTYFKELSRYKKAFTVPTRITGGENEGYEGSFTVFNRGNTTAAGSLSLALHKEYLDYENASALDRAILDAADTIIETEENQGYGIPYLYDGPGYAVFDTWPDLIAYGYEYNSNGRAVNNMIAMAYAYDLSGDSKYLDGVVSGMDYLLGKNPLAFSFITGYGSYHAENPSHRYWRAEQDHTLPSAPDGVLVSGPNGSGADLYMNALGLNPYSSDMPSQRSYADSVESWASNTASVSTNASLAWIVSFIAGETDEPPVKAEAGDVNADGKTDSADAVSLMKHLLGTARVKSADAADLNGDGRLNAVDLTLLKRKLRK